MWNLKLDTDELSVKQKELWLPRGKDGESGISKYKPVYIGWINNKVLLCNTGNCSQYTVISHKGKEYEKEYIYIYISESFFCIAEINTTL